MRDPYVVWATALVGQAGAVTNDLTGPIGVVAGDLAVLVIEQSGLDATPTPSGFSHVPGSPVVDVASAAGSKLSVMTKRFVGDETVRNLSDWGDHQISKLFYLRGASHLDIVAAAATKGTASNAVSAPGLTTVADGSFVVAFASRTNDASNAQFFSAWANASLESIAEILDAGGAAGDGGGFGCAGGIKRVAGAVSATTATCSVSTTNALLTVAFKPARIPARSIDRPVARLKARAA